MLRHGSHSELRHTNWVYTQAARHTGLNGKAVRGGCELYLVAMSCEDGLQPLIDQINVPNALESWQVRSPVWVPYMQYALSLHQFDLTKWASTVSHRIPN